MRNILLVLVLVLCSATAQAQAPVLDPLGIRWEQTETALTAPTQLRVGYFTTPTATSPVQENVVAYTLATTVTGTTKQLLFSALPSYPVGVSYVAKLQTINSAGTSIWSNATVPFGRPGPPAVPVTPALVPRP